jgi:hypothetical protein
VNDSVDPLRDLETIQVVPDRRLLVNVLEREKRKKKVRKSHVEAADVPLSETFTSAFEKCSALINDSVQLQTCGTFSQV